MKIDADAHSLFATRPNPASARAKAQDFASILAQGTAETPKATNGPTESSEPDFTSMTRQELADWMNDGIRDGSMTLDESSPFLGTTMKIAAATGQPVDMATDMTKLDFTEKARQGIDFALSRSDHALAERLQDALELMQGGRGLDIRI